MTVSLLAPAPYQNFAPNSGAKYTSDAKGLITGVPIGWDIRDLITDGCVVLGFGVVGINNITATADPVATNDNTQDYAPGSLWLNSNTARVWMCMSAATGAALWALDGVIPGIGLDPSTMITQFGAGTASFYEEGNILRYTSGPGITPGAIASDNVLASFTVPANSFDIAGRGLNFLAQGNFANSSNTKRCKVFVGCTSAVVGGTVVGGAAIADTGNYSTVGAVGWAIEANLFKTGASGSNTQLALHYGAQMGSSVGSLLPSIQLTMAENAPILIAVTGNATTATSDILLNLLEINAMN